MLPKAVSQVGLDWLSAVERKLINAWHHGSIDRQRLEDWLFQFDNCSKHRWVGEGLLKSLDFWSDERIRESLDLTEAGLSGFDWITVNRHMKAGKSADAIASLVQKQLDSKHYTFINGEVLDFRKSIESQGNENLLFVEDCLITGNEMSRVLDALQGKKDLYGSLKALPLADPASLQSKQITLRFSVVTNAGLTYLHQYLAENGLNNITIDIHASKYLDCLTESGLSALVSRQIYDSQDWVM